MKKKISIIIIITLILNIATNLFGNISLAVTNNKPDSGFLQRTLKMEI